MALMFPNVPQFPGVPPLGRLFNAVGPALQLLNGDVLGIVRNLISPQWGIFDQGGNLVVFADSVVRFDYKQMWTIADYPIEGGSFESYDKVIHPQEIRLRLTRGGSNADRVDFLASLRNIVGDTNLYNIVTPEFQYINFNISDWEFHRTATNGLGLLMVDLLCVEVRVGVSSNFSNTKTAGAANTVNNGVSQPVTATPLQVAVAPGH